MTGDPGPTLGRYPTFLLLDLVTCERKVLAGGEVELRLLAVDICHQIVHSVAKASRSRNFPTRFKPSNRAFLLFLAGCSLFLLEPKVELGDFIGIRIVGKHTVYAHHLFLLIRLHLLKVPGGTGLHLLVRKALLGLGVRKSNLVLGRLGASNGLTDA